MASTIKYVDKTIWPVQTQGTNSYGLVKEFTEADTQSFIYGAPLEYDVSEEDIRLAIDSDVKGAGLAIQPATGTGGTVLKVLMFGPNAVFRAPVLNAGATAAVSKAYIGLNYSFVARTDGLGYGIDLGDTGSNDWFRVIGIASPDVDDTNPGHVLVDVLPEVYNIFSGT